jgi:endonuclease/exonuclease/phosphatase family metal-dependent hydrolase
VSVLTQNLFLGAALAPALEAETETEFERTVESIYRNVLESRFDLRAQALADEIADIEPDVIGLQEAARFAERGGESTTRDYFQMLVDALEERGLSYTERASVKTFDAEFPVTNDSTSDRIRFSNRDVILAREGVETSAAGAGTYYAGSREFGIGRGYCSTTVEGAFTFVNTHLSPPRVPVLQLSQASELSARFRDPPTVLVGDFNSGPNTSSAPAYDVLTNRYTDAYAVANPDEEGNTCCQEPTLTNEASTLDRRIDHIFTRGDVKVRGAERIADDQTARVEGRWPSDHAGVTAELEPP